MSNDPSGDNQEYTEAELEAYLDEVLDADTAGQLEDDLRSEEGLLRKLSMINARRDSGVHTLGEIWRRHQLGVPGREELGSYLLGVLPEPHAEYIRFRLEVLKCPFTIANLNDLNAQQAEAMDQTSTRRQRYFQTSAGFLENPENPENPEDTEE